MKNQAIFQCEKCKKIFIRNFSLKRHMKSIHLGEKDYNCDCGKKTLKGSLF